MWPRQPWRMPVARRTAFAAASSSGSARRRCASGATTESMYRSRSPAVRRGIARTSWNVYPLRTPRPSSPMPRGSYPVRSAQPSVNQRSVEGWVPARNRVSTSIHRAMCHTVSRTLLPRSSARHSSGSSSSSLTRRCSPAPTSSNHFAMSTVSRMARVYGVAMIDDRRRPLREDELARIARAIDPRARCLQSAPLLGGLDAATYALDLDVAGERRELVARIFTFSRQRDGASARRYWRAISGIPANAGLPLPRPILLDAEGGLVGLPCMVMTRLPGAILARPANEASWIDQLAGAAASIHEVDVNTLAADYPRAPEPIKLVKTRLEYWPPKILEDLWRDVADTLWSEERLTGIVDWDSAQIDDPAFDVGYARGDLQLALGRDAADRFLARYEFRRGPLHAVPFWDLVSTLPAFRWLDDWVAGYREVGRSELTDDLARERFTEFVRAALRAL